MHISVSSWKDTVGRLSFIPFKYSVIKKSFGHIFKELWKSFCLTGQIQFFFFSPVNTSPWHTEGSIHTNTHKHTNQCKRPYGNISIWLQRFLLIFYVTHTNTKLRIHICSICLLWKQCVYCFLLCFPLVSLLNSHRCTIWDYYNFIIRIIHIKGNE